jgi:hypothetical protein
MVAAVRQIGLQVDPVELAIAQEGDGRVCGHEALDLGQQRPVGRLGEMPFRRGHDHPAQRQGATVVHHTHQQRQAAAPDNAPVHDQLDRPLGQRPEQRLGHRQEPAVEGVGLVLEKAPEAGDHALLGRAVAGGVVGDRGQVGMSAPDQPADHRHQGVEVLFAMARWTRLVEVHEAPLYGMIPARRVAHGAPPNW